MKKLLFLICTLSVSIAGATHLVSGGGITYKYVGDSLNPHRYEITLQIPGLTAATFATMYYSSPCYDTSSVNLNHFATDYNGADTICVDSARSANLPLQIYKGMVDLDGKCTEWVFYTYSTACCRETFDNFSTLTGLYMEAILNNSKRNNSSVAFHGPVEKYLCLNPLVQQFLEFPHTEPDGTDSLHFTLETPNGNTIVYDPPYTRNNPISSTNGLSINMKTGEITLTPNTMERVLFTLVATEYTFDGSSSGGQGLWYAVGKTKRDIIVEVVSNCSAQSMAWEISSTDTIVSKQKNVQCKDSIISIFTSVSYDPSTLDPLGTDFRLSNSKVSVPIKGAKSISHNEIELELYNPVSFNDSLYLYTKTGNDGNTLLNKCGRYLPSFDSVMVIFEGCNTAGQAEYPMEFSIYPNPAKNELSLEGNIIKAAEYSILSRSGELLLQGSLSENQSIDIAALPAGIYLVRLSSDDQLLYRKFIKL